MSRLFRLVRYAVLLGVLVCVGSAAEPMPTALPAVPPPAARVVACDAWVRSPKRGLCLNHLAPADFLAVAPGVSWYYNWHYTETEPASAAAKMEFLPMVWGGDAAAGDGLKAYLTSLDAKGWVDYQVAVSAAGDFPLSVRVNAPLGSRVVLSAGAQEVASITTAAEGWQTCTTSIALPAGNQSLRVTATAPVRLGWLEFRAAE